MPVYAIIAERKEKVNGGVPNMKERKFSTYQIVFVAVMAALVCVVTFFRFPLLGSKVHFANAMCLLSGMRSCGRSRLDAL